MALVDRVPWGVVVVLCLGLGLAPFFEEPHLVEKTQMLFAGELTKGIDRIDLLWHSWPFVLLAAKVTRRFAGSEEAEAEPEPS